jgi:hypothetical protein|nr:MAG TPA: Protein of unknown function (DUF3168) [Caudoviricetes sp.]DAU06777.1 MAG TPA: Protein of unknown function (DUF3168) [Caudoviricetes sp.]
MTNALLIGNVIAGILTEYKGEILNKKNISIYPAIAVPERDNNMLGYITYQRLGVSSINTKDGTNQDRVTFQINVVFSHYTNGVIAAQEVRAAIEKNKIDTEAMTLYYIKLIDAEESFDYDSYIQSLTFECVVE